MLESSPLPSSRARQLGLLLMTLVFGLTLAIAQRPGGPGGGERPAIASVFGQIVDSETREGIPFASVALLSLRDSTIASGQLADESGRFNLTEVPMGRYSLQVNFMGYAAYASPPIALSPRTGLAHDAGRIELVPRINELEEAAVFEEASSLEMLIDRRVFKVGNDLSAAGGTASELLVNVPSVAVDIDGNVSMRGSSQVQILIDGRPSGLTGAAQNAFLEQIPASSIDRVEVITNPSAKYDPDGMAGILNIVLKKNKLQGFHGQAQATPGTGGNHNASLSLNYKNERFSVFSSGSWNQRDMFRVGETYRELSGTDSSSTTDQVRDGNQLRTSLNGRIGMEWYPSKSEVIAWNVNVNQNERDHYHLLENSEVWSTGTAFQTDRISEELSAGEGWDLDGSYRKEFNQNPRHFLFAQVRHSRSQSQSDEFIEEWALGSDAFALDTNIQANQSTRTVAQVDFEKPLPNDGKWEWGWKSNLSQKDDAFEFLTSDTAVWQDGVYIPLNPVKSTFDFKYREDVHAIYTTLGRKYGVYGIQAGMRLEQVFTEAQWEADASFTNDYFSAYPSLNVSKQRNDEVSWIASYSRRVNRPHGRSVSPFVDDSDSRNIRTGNPELRPEYTNSMEIGHQWSRNRASLTTSLFWKITNDIIQRYSSIDELGVRTSSWINQGTRQNEGLEIIAMAPLPGRGQARITASLYHLQNDVGDVEFANDATGWSYDLNFFANQSMGKDGQWKWQLNGMYRGPSVTPQGQFNGYAFMDANLQHTLMDGNLTLALKLSDVFDTREWSYLSEFANLYQENRFKRESRNVFLTATWKIGKLEERSRSGSGRGGYDGSSGGSDGMEF
jgi:outer membrane receptor protein involved in Fe transport